MWLLEQIGKRPFVSPQKVLMHSPAVERIETNLLSSFSFRKQFLSSIFAACVFPTVRREDGIFFKIDGKDY
jgi:hypothetical protein